MILQALKEYYDRKAADPVSGIAPLGWEKKEIPFLIVLNSNASPVAIEDTREVVGKKKRAKSFLVPQSAKRSSGIKSNLFWDNTEYALGIGIGSEEKHKAFLNLLNQYADVPDVSTIILFLKSSNIESSLSAFASWSEIKEESPFLSFKIAGRDNPVFREPSIVARINDTQALQSAEKAICLVTGEEDSPVTLHSAIKGVQGANTTGGNIISFNFDAAKSFGKNQGLNAPIGSRAAFSYTTALNTLLDRDSKQKLQIGDATTAFWSAKKDNFEETFGDFWSEPDKDDPDRLCLAVASLFKSAETGAFISETNETKFYVLGLSPNAARIAVRFWHTGTIAELSAHFREYFDDLRIVHGPRDKDDLSLWRLLLSTAALHKSENISPNLAGNVVRSILEGLPLPEILFKTVILRIKAEREVTYPRAKLIKGCINRKLRRSNPNNERSLTMSLDKSNVNAGYRLGRLFATLEKIQQEANPGINATIRDKFYASASSTPSTVFGNLMRLKNHHLTKLDNSGRRINFEKLLGEIIDGLDCFPSHLMLDDQGQFAIGYYHQAQDFFTKKADKTNE